jgi:hypothetical protein
VVEQVRGLATVRFDDGGVTDVWDGGMRPKAW